MMDFTGEFESDVPREQLWNYFTDPQILEACGPGCEKMRQVNPAELDAILAVGVGSVKPTFDVDVTVTRTQYPELLEMSVSGADNRTSFESVAEMTLRERADGGTDGEWAASANVSGLLASLGQRALGSVTNKLVSDFFEDVEAMAQEGVPAESKLDASSDEEATLE